MWEALDCGRELYAVIGSEDDSMRPLAIFATRDHAEDWADYICRRIDEDHRDNRALAIVEVRRLDGLAWNSVDPPPVLGGLEDPGVRDPDSPCGEYAPGCPCGHCDGDGHYLCAGCQHWTGT